MVGSPPTIPHPQALLTCNHDPLKALCDPNRGKPGGHPQRTPSQDRCHSACGNISRTDTHVERIQAEIDRIEAELADGRSPAPRHPPLTPQRRRMTSTPDRTTGLRAARAKDSAEKRRRALDAIHALEAAGTPITAAAVAQAAVAQAAAVSTWLVYTHGLREHLDAARRRQAPPPSSLPRTTAPADQAPLTPASLSTDLALARAEIRRLRADTDKLL